MEPMPFGFTINPERQRLADKGPLYALLLINRTPAQVETLIKEMTQKDNYPIEELEFLGQTCRQVIIDMENSKELATELLTVETGQDDFRWATTEKEREEQIKKNEAVIRFCKYRLNKMGASPMTGSPGEVTDMVNGVYGLGQKPEKQ
jgi:hypothetical protein